jgi:hypothetical protein
MTTYGITTTGFVAKTQDEIVADIVLRQKASPLIGPNQDYSANAALGQLNYAIGASIAEIWELAERVYAALDPNAATGNALIQLCSLTGTAAQAATATRIACTVNLDAGIILPSGSQASVAGRPDLQFQTITSVTNSSAFADDFPVDFYCTAPGTGPVAVNAGTLTVIDTAVSGWNSVTNAADGVTGLAADTNITLRQRREDQLALRGGSTVRAIRADLLDFANNPELVGIESVLVLENDTDVVDVHGLPPHSFEVVLDDGATPSVDNDAIAQVIFDGKPGGITSYGSSNGSATDEYGIAHTVYFSRVTRMPVYLSLTLTTSSSFPVDGTTQIKNALVTAGAEIDVGEDVIALYFRAQCFSVSGVTDVPTFYLGFSPSPSGTSNLTIGYRQRATFDTSRITVA